MKTKFLTLLLVIALAISLAACTSSKNPSNDDSPKGEQQTTAPDTTEAQTEPEAKLAINDDLIADIGLTYPKLVEKHGARETDVLDYAEGGYGFRFQNGYGAYFWGYNEFDDSGLEQARTETGFDPKKMPDPRTDIPCYSIERISAEDLFLNTDFPMNTDKIKDIDGVKTDSVEKDSTFDGGPVNWPTEYCTSFFFKDISVSIFHNEKGLVDKNSEVRLQFKSSN